MPVIMFILGAGASYDSGISTYRGPTGTGDVSKFLNIDSYLKDPVPVREYFVLFREKIKDIKPGPTYKILAEIISSNKGSFILSQNIDGLTKGLPCDVFELHGNLFQQKSYDPEMPNVLLYGETVDMKEFAKFMWKRPKPDYVICLGTTLQFPYLRNIIQKTRTRKDHRIFINPDPESFENAKDGEVKIDRTAVDGLSIVSDMLKS